jgi:hypothetical protein
VDKPLGFVALKSIKQGPQDPKAALGQIREIYFRTTKRTIEHDMAHAIELLKSLPDEDERDKAAVYMQGLAQMQRDWTTTNDRDTKTGSRNTGKAATRRGRGGANRKRPSRE